jgi:hypothetical protein
MLDNVALGIEKPKQSILSEDSLKGIQEKKNKNVTIEFFRNSIG